MGYAAKEPPEDGSSACICHPPDAGLPVVIRILYWIRVIRLILIWYYSWQVLHLSMRSSLVRSAKAWLPYLVAMGVFVSWRLFFITSARPTTNAGHLFRIYASNLIHMLLRGNYRNWRKTSSKQPSWPGQFRFIVIGIYPTYRELLAGLTLAFMASAAVFAYYRLYQAHSASNETKPGEHWVWIGIVAIAFALIPSELSNRTWFSATGLTDTPMPAMIGVGLFLAGLIFNYVKSKSSSLGDLALGRPGSADAFQQCADHA